MTTNHTTSLEKISDWDDMEGKAIRCVVDRPKGEHGHRGHAVIVFEDNSFAVINGERDDDETIVTLRAWGCNNISEILSPQQLLDAGLITIAQLQLLVEAKRKRDQERAEQEAARLRHRLTALGPLPSDEARNKAITDAADLIEAEAARLAESHAPKGDWTGEDAAKVEHDAMMGKAAALRALVPVPVN